MVIIKYKVDDIGLYFKKIREENKLTMKIVSERTGLTAGFISRIENGSSKPSLKTIFSLCSVYSINPNDVVEINGEIDDTKDISVDLEMVLGRGVPKYNGDNISVHDQLIILKFIQLLMSAKNEKTKDIISNLVDNINNIIKATEEK